MTDALHGRRVLVTGANRGIGRATATALAGLGMDVWVAARRPAAAEEAAAALAATAQGRIRPLQLDVTDEASRLAARDTILAADGGLDVLVNNAGVLLDPGWLDRPGSPSVFDVDLDIVRETMEANLYGPMRLCQLFVPGMVEAGWGRVVNVSSGMGQLDDMQGGFPGYRLSKVALNALTAIVAAEVRDSGADVKVNTLCPGWVHTDMGGAQAPRTPEAAADTVVWLATLAADGPSGGFFRNREPIPW